MSFEPKRDNFDLSNPRVSFVIPFLDEENTLKVLRDQIDAVMRERQTTYEIIFINDGSKDGSERVCRTIANTYKNVTLINFRSNFGKSAALSAGFGEARGEIVMTLDADLQDDPVEIPRFLDAIEKGVDVVCGWKKVRHDPLGKTVPSKLFNAVVNKTFGLKLRDHNCGFKAYQAQAVKSLNLYGELHRFVPALLHSRGYTLHELPVQHQPRKFGVSKFGASRLIKGALDLMTVKLTTRYAARPLHVFGTLGMIMLLVGGLCLSYLTCAWLFGEGPIGDRPLLLFGILLMLFGSQLISTGLIGEIILSRSMVERSKYEIRDIVAYNAKQLDGLVKESLN